VPEPVLGIDHVVIGVTDLEAAGASLSDVLGRAPSWRGRHLTYGTANVLYRLDNAYLELLALDPNAQSGGAWTEYLRSFLVGTGVGLFALALSTADVEATIRAVRERGLPAEDPAAGEGVDLMTGAVRRWRNARVPPAATPGTALFFIQHDSPAEALPPAPFEAAVESAAMTVLALSFEAAAPDGATVLWRDRVGLMQAPAGGFALSNARLMPLAGPATAPRWRRLVLGVSSVAAAVERLKGRYELAVGDFEEASGVRVACCGVDLLLAERL
jgi:catechol 2,3-dioxygenase-like lactoylglutathione lyase family enzyme